MDANLVQVNIIDVPSFLQACDLLHDARFDLSSMEFDRATGNWKGIFEREFLEDESLVTRSTRFFIFKRTSFPLAQTELRLEGIKSCEVNDRARIGQYPFDELEIEDGRYMLKFSGTLQITFTFHGNPRGTMKDLKLLDRRGSF